MSHIAARFAASVLLSSMALVSQAAYVSHTTAQAYINFSLFDSAVGGNHAQAGNSIASAFGNVNNGSLSIYGLATAQAPTFSNGVTSSVDSTASWHDRILFQTAKVQDGFGQASFTVSVNADASVIAPPDLSNAKQVSYFYRAFLKLGNTNTDLLARGQTLYSGLGYRDNIDRLDPSMVVISTNGNTTVYRVTLPVLAFATMDFDFLLAGHASASVFWGSNGQKASGLYNLGHTIYWGGFDSFSIRGVNQDFSVASDSGIDWRQSFIPSVVPVPEPAEWMLLTLGLASLVARQRYVASRKGLNSSLTTSLYS